MNPIQLFDPLSSTYTYVLFDVTSRDALIIDPVDEQIERDLSVLREYGLKLAWTVETHAHADHITSAGQLAEHAGARTAAPEGCGITTAAEEEVAHRSEEVDERNSAPHRLLPPDSGVGGLSDAPLRCTQQGHIYGSADDDHDPLALAHIAPRFPASHDASLENFPSAVVHPAVVLRLV